jgi:hypothetical protein
MKRIISITRIVDSHEVTRGTREVIASADATFDEGKSELVVDLDSKVQVTDARGHEALVTEDWLPHRTTVREHLSLSDAPDAAKEIFESWAHKIRESIPALVET